MRTIFYLLSRIFGSGKYQSKLKNHPEYGAAFHYFLQKNGGDERAAELDILRISRTPAGQYKLKRMAMSLESSPSDSYLEQNFRAKSLNGDSMFE